jgi:hypothetical protein
VTTTKRQREQKKRERQQAKLDRRAQRKIQPLSHEDTSSDSPALDAPESDGMA